jgi:raffinose/stachyose/melibiose transport system permease protein
VEAPPASTANFDVEREAPTPRGELRSTDRLARRPSVALLALAPALALYAVFVLWPVLQVAWLSLHQWNGYGPQTWVGLGNVVTLWADPVFRTSLMHSALWEVAAALVPTLLGLGLALLLVRARGRTLLLSLLFFPVLLSPAVVAAVWVLVYSPDLGFPNTVLRAVGLGRLAPGWLGDPHLALGALFVAWLWSALGVAALIFWAGLQAIGREYVELALIEGAGGVWIVRHVILPGLRRFGLIVLLINAALGAQVFDLVFVTTGGGPGYATMILPVDAYGRAFGGYTGQGAASAFIQVVLGLLLAAAVLLLLRRPGESLDTGDTSLPQGRRPRLLPTVIGVAIILLLLLPLAWLVVAALEPGRSFALGTSGPGLDPRSWAWSNFSAVWQEGMGNAILTSLWLALAVVAAVLLLATPAALSLTYLRRSGAWRWGVAALLLFGQFIPPSVLIITLFSLLQALGVLDTPWGILLPEIARALPFAVLVLWGYVSGLPRDVLEAAEVDGAAPWQQLIYIALPLTRPAVLVAAIWAFVASWNEYLLPTVVSQDGSLQTVPTLLATFIGKYDTQFGLLAAGSLIAMLPTLLIYLTMRRSASRGLTGAEHSLP